MFNNFLYNHRSSVKGRFPKFENDFALMSMDNVFKNIASCWSCWNPLGWPVGSPSAVQCENLTPTSKQSLVLSETDGIATNNLCIRFATLSQNMHYQYRFLDAVPMCFRTVHLCKIGLSICPFCPYNNPEISWQKKNGFLWRLDNQPKCHCWCLISLYFI